MICWGCVGEMVEGNSGWWVCPGCGLSAPVEVAVVHQPPVAGHLAVYVPDRDAPRLLWVSCRCGWESAAAGRRVVAELWARRHVCGVRIAVPTSGEGGR